MDLWRREISAWIPSAIKLANIEKQTFFGGLYQKVVVRR
jgi:hypothetical protein